MSFQSGSHMFFQCTGVRTDPRHIPVKFQSEEAAPIHRLNNPHPTLPFPGATEDTVQQSKKARGRKGRPMNQVAQLRTDAQGISGMRRDDDL